MADDNVVNFTGITRHEMPVAKILEHVPDDMDSIIVIGYTKDGDEYMATSYSDAGDIVWLLEKMKYQLFKISDNLSGEDGPA